MSEHDRHPHISSEQLAAHAKKSPTPHPVTATDRPPVKPVDAAAPTIEPQATPSEGAPAVKKRHTTRNVLLAILGVIVAGLGIWDISSRVSDNAAPAARATKSAGAAQATPKEIAAAVHFKTLYDTKTETAFCPLVAHPQPCLAVPAGPAPGLRSKITVEASAAVPAENAQPAVAAVILSATTGENTAPDNGLVIIRRSDLRVLAELPDLSQADQQQPLAVLAAGVLNGSVAGGVTW